MSSEPKYKKGDLIQHRASLERGIVAYSHKWCSNEDHYKPFYGHDLLADTGACIIEFSEKYTVNTKFKTLLEVLEYEIELVGDSPIDMLAPKPEKVRLTSTTNRIKYIPMSRVEYDPEMGRLTISGAPEGTWEKVEGSSA